MIRSNEVIGIKNAAIWGRVGGIAARDGRRLSTGIELGQAVNGLVWIAILRPVFSQRTKVVIERAIFLRQENNVIEKIETLSLGEGCADLRVRCHGHCAR